ncbi:putative aldouronate transport system substrate-binding protein [Paenibacillus sp. 1_12]|uniref:extracellular solute-binding protein n=1 Tax=Paenibacillus sp. 1_12 TaxID=1566278 RepID=UPI0008EE198F|nr:extracellular solute-binding protein [Paenibacillus sp. 1_12]SFK97969.1 putative aldouronate transport system substrate-binding protein [Paenibacillus sp. 1_12]
MQTKRLVKQGLLAAGALSLAITSACANGTETKPGAAAATGPVEITMMNQYLTAEPPKMDSEPMKLLQEYTNTKLNVTWVPSASYSEKVTASIAVAGDLPKLLLVKDDRNPAIIEAAKAGLFWELGPYLKDYPNLKTMDEARLSNISIEGKVYGIYRWRAIARNGIIIRKDWLDNLGLQEPKTIDELLNVFKAFTYNDPDKNGKNDTFGISFDSNSSLILHLLAAMGTPNLWAYNDGKMTPDFMTKPYMDGLKLIQQMFKDKVMNSDFPVVKDRTVLMNQGKAGVYIGAYDDLNARFTDLFKANPNAKLDTIANVSGPNGVKVQAGTGYNSVFMIPKTSVKTEAELKQVLTFIDKLGDEKVQTLMNWGIEGKHYKLENGKAIRIDEKVYTDEVYNTLFQLMVFDGSKALQGNVDPAVTKFNKLIADNEKFAVPNPALPLLSKTYMEKGKQLDQVISDARTKFIIGEIDEKGFEQAVANWQKIGGDQVMAEYKTEYDKISKK